MANPHIGHGQCRGIIDAITGHTDDLVLPLQLSHLVGLLLREHFCKTPVTPTRLATALAVSRLSPLSITTRIPLALSRAIA